MPPHISTWTQNQAIGYAALFGILGAAVVVGILYALSRFASRERPKPDGLSSQSKVNPGRPLPRRVLVTNVTDCARCGGNHPKRLLLPFTNPPAPFTHYTVCPETEEPILVTVTDVPDVKSDRTLAAAAP